jgi:hypothetical protein
MKWEVKICCAKVTLHAHGRLDQTTTELFMECPGSGFKILSTWSRKIIGTECSTYFHEEKVLWDLFKEAWRVWGGHRHPPLPSDEGTWLNSEGKWLILFFHHLLSKWRGFWRSRQAELQDRWKLGPWMAAEWSKLTPILLSPSTLNYAFRNELIPRPLRLESYSFSNSSAHSNEGCLHVTTSFLIPSFVLFSAALLCWVAFLNISHKF